MKFKHRATTNYNNGLSIIGNDQITTTVIGNLQIGGTASLTASSSITNVQVQTVSTSQTIIQLADNYNIAANFLVYTLGEKYTGLIRWYGQVSLKIIY